MILTTAALAAAEAGLNRILDLDPAARRELTALEGLVFHIHLTDLELDLYLLPGARIRLASHWEAPVTTALRGRSSGFLRLLRAEDAAAELINSDMTLEGDSRALMRLQAALSQLDPDWEAPLALLLGDVPAHTIGRGLRSGLRWLRYTGDSLTRQFNDYWREESGHMVPREAWDDFASAVDASRAQLDRLEARLQRLRAKHGIKP